MLTKAHGFSKHGDTPDALLIEAALANPDAFGAIVEKYWDPLFRYVRRIGFVSAEEAEDILQETFLNAYRKLHEYESDMKLGSWLYRIAHNQTIDTFRRADARPKSISLDDDEWHRLFVSATDMERELFAKDRLAMVKRALSRVPDRYREVLVLRFLEEKDYEEIMDILEKPKGTVATLIARGRRILLEELVKEDGSIKTIV